MFNKKGFTLTEMLFVVVIAAGILALALPSYKKAKERSQYQAATGMLMDLGSAVEAITNDLAMQSLYMTVGANDQIRYANIEDVVPDPEHNKGTILEIYKAAGSTNAAKSAAVLGMLRPFKYLDSFAEVGGYEYYVGTGKSDGCAENTQVNPRTGTVVACMLKSSADSTGCFKGARYYRGGRIQTIRGSNCKNSD